MSLPTFRYHPDPIVTGSIAPSNEVCQCCGRARGYVYTGIVHTREEVDTVCPWCIADGSAHERYDGSFTDAAGIGGSDPYNRASNAAKAEVAFRTPGFSGWQEERWLAHCGDACAYVGPAGYREIIAFDSPELIASLRQDTVTMIDDADFPDFLRAFDRDTQPVAFVFQCLHCGILQGYVDFS